jgi:ribokinase
VTPTPDPLSPPRVGIVGNLTTDLVLAGVPGLPSWGEEVCGSRHQRVPAGQAYYLALGLARLGDRARLLGVVGADDEGNEIVRGLEEAGVDAAPVVVSSERSTALTVAIVRPDGERAFVSDFACQAEMTPELVDAGWPSLAETRLLAFVGLFNLPAFPPEAGLALLRRARSAGLQTAVDTGWDPHGWSPHTVRATRELLAETDVFLPNMDEARALTGESDPAAAAALLSADGAGIVVVKCGADGCVGRAGSVVHRLPAQVTAVHDAVGAGDAFDAAFLHAHLRGSGLEASMRFATVAAGLYVSRSSDRPPTVQQVRAALPSSGRS